MEDEKMSFEEVVVLAGKIIVLVALSPIALMIYGITSWERHQISKRMSTIPLFPEVYAGKLNTVWLASMDKFGQVLLKTKVPVDWSADKIYREVATKWWGLKDPMHPWGLMALGTKAVRCDAMGRTRNEKVIILDDESAVRDDKHQQGLFMPELGKNFLLVYVLDSLHRCNVRVFTYPGEMTVAEALDDAGVRYGSTVSLNGLPAELTDLVVPCSTAHRWEYRDMAIAYVIVE